MQHIKDKYLVINGNVKCVSLYSIYMIKSGDLIKVGVTKNLQRRFQQINSYRFDCEVLYESVKVLNGYEVECQIHSALRDYRAVGNEWYSAADHDMILSVIELTIGNYGDFADRYVEATREQIDLYIKESNKEISRWFNSIRDSIMCESAQKKLEGIDRVCTELLQRFIDTQSSCCFYNYELCIEAQCLYECFVDLGYNFEFDVWFSNVIMKNYKFVEGYDYYVLNDVVYFSASAFLCICMSNEFYELYGIIQCIKQTIFSITPDISSICYNAGAVRDNIYENGYV